MSALAVSLAECCSVQLKLFLLVLLSMAYDEPGVTQTLEVFVSPDTQDTTIWGRLVSLNPSTEPMCF